MRVGIFIPVYVDRFYPQLAKKSSSHIVLPFVCEHLVLVVLKSRIVGNMHYAYKFF